MPPLTRQRTGPGVQDPGPKAYELVLEIFKSAEAPVGALGMTLADAARFAATSRGAWEIYIAKLTDQQRYTINIIRETNLNLRWLAHELESAVLAAVQQFDEGNIGYLYGTDLSAVPRVPMGTLPWRRFIQSVSPGQRGMITAVVKINEDVEGLHHAFTTIHKSSEKFLLDLVEQSYDRREKLVKGIVYDDGYDKRPVAIGKFGLMSLLAAEDLPISLNMARANREHAALACYISPKHYSLPYFMDRGETVGDAFAGIMDHLRGGQNVEVIADKQHLYHVTYVKSETLKNFIRLGRPFTNTDYVKGLIEGSHVGVFDMHNGHLRLMRPNGQYLCATVDDRIVCATPLGKSQHEMIPLHGHEIIVPKEATMSKDTLEAIMTQLRGESFTKLTNEAGMQPFTGVTDTQKVYFPRLVNVNLYASPYKMRLLQIAYADDGAVSDWAFTGCYDGQGRSRIKVVLCYAEDLQFTNDEWIMHCICFDKPKTDEFEEKNISCSNIIGIREVEVSEDTCGSYMSINEHFDDYYLPSGIVPKYRKLCTGTASE